MKSLVRIFSCPYNHYGVKPAPEPRTAVQSAADIEGGPVARKTRINIGDRTIEAEDMEFKTEREEWNEYQIEDSFTVRVKLVVSSILKTGERDRQGNPVYIAGRFLRRARAGCAR
jgi:hypothetical protein